MFSIRGVQPSVKVSGAIQSERKQQFLETNILVIFVIQCYHSFMLKFNKTGLIPFQDES